MAVASEDALRALAELEKQELSIVKLSEPILNPEGERSSPFAKRSSDVSTADPSSNPTLESLRADLEHYKELFTKLRFSYVEQCTKERFLRAVVGDPPLYASYEENAKLEADLVQAKAALKAQKVDLNTKTEDLERKGRELSERYYRVQTQSEQLRALPAEIEQLNADLEILRRQQRVGSAEPEMSLPLAQTQELLTQRERELEQLDLELAELDEKTLGKTQELESMEAELSQLQTRKAQAVRNASEARRRKEQGMSGVGDALEEQGRWLRGVETTLRSLLEDEAEEQ